MKICIFHKLSPPFTYGMACEGGSRSVLEIAKRLAKSNWVFIVNTNENSFQDSKNHVFFIGTGTLELAKKLSSIFPEKMLGKLDPWIRDTLIHVAIGLLKTPRKIDVLHATTPFAIMLKGFFGIKSKVNVLHLHEPPRTYAFLSAKLRSLFLRNLTAVVANSNYTKKEFIRLFAFDPDKVHVVYNGVDYESYNCGDYFEKSYNTILFVGAIVPQKGLHHLLKAVKIVQERIPEIKLRIVGAPSLWYASPEYGRYFETVLKFSKQLRNVEFLGIKYGEELVRAYKTATVAVVPSVVEETFGLVVLEAMAAGLPVIASQTGGLIEIVKHEETGLLVPPNNVEALANTLERLIENEELRNKLAEKAQNMVKRQYTWDSSLRQLCNVYSKHLT